MDRDDADTTSGLTGLALRGARMALTGSTAREAFRAVDIGALLDGQRIDEAIEREQAGELLGRLLGRALAEELADGGRVQAFAVRLAGQRVGARLGQVAIVGLLEYGLLASAIDELRGLTTDDAVLSLLDEIDAAATPDDTSGSEGPTGFDADGNVTGDGSAFDDGF